MDKLLVSVGLMGAGFLFHLIVKMMDFSQTNPNVPFKNFFDRNTILTIIFSLGSLVPIYLGIPDAANQTYLTYFTVGYANSSLLKSVTSFVGSKIGTKNVQ